MCYSGLVARAGRQPNPPQRDPTTDLDLDSAEYRQEPSEHMQNPTSRGPGYRTPKNIGPL